MSDRDRLKRPRVLTRCPANAHTGAGERIIEFSFPGRGKDGSVAGGLISFRDQGADTPPRVEVYRTDGQVDVIAPRAKYWAAYAGTANGSAITLHPTYRDALEAVYLALDLADSNDDPDEPMDDDRMVELIADHCNGGADDWEVQEVETP